MLGCRTIDLELPRGAVDLATADDQRTAAALLATSGLLDKLGPVGEWDVIESLLKAVAVPDLPLHVLGMLYNRLCIACWRQSKIEPAEAYNRAAFDAARRCGDQALQAGARQLRQSAALANNAAVAAERHRVFGAVIGRPSNGFGWPSVEQLLYEDDHAIPPEVGAHLPMQAAQHVECVRPLFLASAEVFLVDTYFTLRTTSGERDRQRWQVLVAFLKLAEEARTCEVLRLILARARIDETEG